MSATSDLIFLKIVSEHRRCIQPHCLTAMCNPGKHVFRGRVTQFADERDMENEKIAKILKKTLENFWNQHHLCVGLFVQSVIKSNWWSAKTAYPSTPRKTCCAGPEWLKWGNWRKKMFFQTNEIPVWCLIWLQCEHWVTMCAWCKKKVGYIWYLHEEDKWQLHWRKKTSVLMKGTPKQLYTLK
mgnify:CR=1 FL=1